MEGIQTRPAQVPTKWSKAKKHAVNAGVTAAGLAGTAMTAKFGAVMAVREAFILGDKNNVAYTNIYDKVGRLVNKFGDKLFKNSGFIRSVAEKTEKVILQVPEYQKSIEHLLDGVSTKNFFGKAVKGVLASYLVGGTIGLGVLAHGIYKAVKINGEGM